MLENTEKLIIDYMDDTTEDVIETIQKLKHNSITSTFWRYFPWTSILKSTQFNQVSLLEALPIF